MSGTTVTWRGVTIHIPLAIEAADEAKTIAYERAEFARVLGWSEAEVDAERVRELEVIQSAKGEHVAFPDLISKAMVGAIPPAGGEA